MSHYSNIQSEPFGGQNRLLPFQHFARLLAVRPGADTYILIGWDTYRHVIHTAWLFHNWKSVLILARSGLEVGRDLYLCFSPERVDPGNPKDRHVRQ